MEFAILDFIQSHMRCGFLDFFLPKITALGDAGIIWIILTLLFILSKRYRATGQLMFISLILMFLTCNVVLKPLIARVRPYDINTAVTLLIPPQTDYSFPSGHSAASFAAAYAMYKSNCGYWKAAMVLAVIIAFSRLYLYVHYPTDVICGIVIGILCATVGNILLTAKAKKSL